MEKALLNPFAPHHRSEYFSKPASNALQNDCNDNCYDEEIIPGSARHDNDRPDQDMPGQPGASPSRSKDWAKYN